MLSGIILVDGIGRLPGEGERKCTGRALLLRGPRGLSMWSSGRCPLGRTALMRCGPWEMDGTHFVSVSTMTPEWMPDFERGVCSHCAGAGEDKSCLTSLNSSAPPKLQKRGWR